MKTKLLGLIMLFSVIVGCSVIDTDSEASESQVLPKISVQLWSVKTDLTNDFKGTLTRLSEMGFDSVEFAGNFGPFENDAAGLKQYLDSLNLTVSGAHVSYDSLSEQNIEKTATFYKTLGAKYLVIAWDERAWHSTKVIEMVEQLNSIQPKVEAYGLVFGYHNHDQEFNQFEGETYWDYIGNNTNEQFLLQLDVGWVNYAKQDAIHFVEKFPNRTLTTHYKIRTHKTEDKPVILGDDTYDWASLIKTNIDVGGTQWIVVEQEEYIEGLSELETVKLSKMGLDKIIEKL